MEATEKKGVWIERLPKGYQMKVDTSKNEFTVYSPSKEVLLIVEIPGGIYPRDVERVRDLAVKKFKITHLIKKQPCQN